MAGAVGAGAGIAPTRLTMCWPDQGLCDRVGSGPFPTELFDEIGQHLATKGNEFGSVTGRPRRCGWFDAAALRRAIQINGVTGFVHHQARCLGCLKEIKLCTGLRDPEGRVDVLPFGAGCGRGLQAHFSRPGPAWAGSTAGLQKWEDLPKEAQAYLSRLAEVTGAPIAMISTGLIGMKPS